MLQRILPKKQNYSLNQKAELRLVWRFCGVVFFERSRKYLILWLLR